MHKIEIPLDIPDVEIENIEMNKEGDVIITVRSTVKGTSCHKRGQKDYQTAWTRPRDYATPFANFGQEGIHSYSSCKIPVYASYPDRGRLERD